MTSAQDLVLLDKFRQQIQTKFSTELDNYILIIYLRASEMDVSKAMNLFETFLKLQENLIGTRQIVEYTKHPSVAHISDDIRYKSLGTDARGRMVVWLGAGRWDLRRHLENGLRNELVIHCFKCILDLLRQLYEIEVAAGEEKTIVVIADFEGLTFQKATHVESLEIAIRCLKDIQVLTHVLHKFYIVNAHWVTRYLLNILKPFLTRHTKKRLVLLNPKKEWKPILQENIPLDILPTEYGGNGQPVLV